MIFNDRLRTTRIYRGYTIQSFADKIGRPMRTYQNYEQGNRTPDLELLPKIADALNVPLDFLFGRDEYLDYLGVFVDVPRTNPPRRPKPRTRRQAENIPPSDSI